MNNAGKLVTADIYLREMPSNQTLAVFAERAIEASGMQIVNQVLHPFEPQGMTAIWVLAESHFAIHTYPEHKYLSVDIYTCGQEGNPNAALSAFVAYLNPEAVDSSIILRGKALKTHLQP